MYLCPITVSDIRLKAKLVGANSVRRPYLSCIIADRARSRLGFSTKVGVFSMFSDKALKLKPVDRDVGNNFGVINR